MTPLNNEQLALIKSDAENGYGANVGDTLRMIAELAAIKEGQGEAVAWQFLDHDGKWYTGSDRNNHRQNTEDAGYQIRELFAAPPATGVDDLIVPRELLKTLLIGHLGIGHKAAKQELRALLAQQGVKS